jgi:LacI family transcriptional regulator
MPAKKITISEIAKLAGVSTGTVSRALNGTGRISEETKERIKKIIQKTGFTPDYSAQRLARGTTQLIGLAPASPTLRRPYYSYLLEAVQEAFFERGYMVRVLEPENNHDVASCAGFIVPGLYVDDARPQILRQMGIPTVLIGYPLEGCGAVEIMQQQGIHHAMQHLVGLGHRRIAHVAELFPARERLTRYDAYREALHQAGLEFDPEIVVNGAFGELDAYRGVAQMLRKKLSFSAVFAASDELAAGTIRALEDFGLRVPHDVSVIGFDDLPFARHFSPALTTIRQPIAEIGQHAATILLEHFEGAPLRTVQVQTQLMLRHSSAPVLR